MSYFQPEMALDFDDTNAFLAALADTVPSVEKNPDWAQAIDLDSIYPPVFEREFENSSPEVASSNGSLDEMLSAGGVGGSISSNSNSNSNSQDMQVSDPLTAFYVSNNDNMNMPYAEDAEDSYTNSMGSTVSPYLDFSPHSGHGSWQTSPLTEGGVDFGAFNGFAQQNAGPEIRKEVLLPVRGNGNPVKLESVTPEPTQDLKPQTTHAKVGKPAKKPKTSHNVIEKKYRTSINSKILELREVVPTLKYATGKTRVSMADLDGLSPACKLNKASILTKANEYIKHMQKKNKALQKKISALQELVANADSTSAQQPQAITPDSQPSLDEYTSEDLYQRRGLSRFTGDDNVDNNYSTYSVTNTHTQPIQSTGFVVDNYSSGTFANSNVFFGGLATLMGSSYINDNNFQAMSALPLFPTSLFGNSVMNAHLVNTLRFITMGLGLVMIAYSVVGNFHFNSGKDKKQRLPESVSWVLSFIGVGPRDSFSNDDRMAITSHLLGKKPASSRLWVKIYLRLRTKEPSFETMLLQYLVGTVIMKNGGLLSKFVAFDLKLKRLAFTSMEYVGNNEDLAKIHRMFKTVDGLSIFESQFFSQRLYNLSHKLPICQGVVNGENSSLFVDSVLRNENNLYKLIFEWRILEIVHELTLVYLDLLSSPESALDEGLEELKSDAAKVGELVADLPYLNRQFSYFKLLLTPQVAPQVLSLDKKYILNTLQSINSRFEEPELTDEEEICDDESDVSIDGSETSTSLTERPDSFYLLKHQKSMVCTLNLMNEEKFIVLISSLVSYYLNNDETEKSLELLNRLKFKDQSSSMSLLSFTCLLKLLFSIVPSEETDDLTDKTPDIATNLSSQNCLVLESLVKTMKSWLNDETKPNFLTNTLRGDLSNLVLSKGIALNKV